MGDFVLLYESASRRGVAANLDIDETGAAAEFQGQTFEVAQYCVRCRNASDGVGEVGWNRVSDSSDALGGIPSITFGKILESGV